MSQISAIVCTHNRLRYLEGSIGSLSRQTLDPSEFEIILVDNASTDGTAAWVKQAQQRVPNLVYVHEPKLGLSHGRNAGWRAARAELVAFLDDDAIAASDWLEKIAEKFRERDDKLAAIGGKVDPLWEAPRPDWLVPDLWGSLSVLDWSPRDMVMGDWHYFAGVNMAIRKSALERVGGYRSDLGRKGQNLLSNEELHLKRQLEAVGYYSLYTPSVLVEHSIPPERMTKQWFRNRSFWQGRSEVIMESIIDASDVCASPSQTPSAWRQFRGTARLMLDAFKGFPRWRWRQQLLPELGWYYRYGRVVQCWRLWLARNSDKQ